MFEELPKMIPEIPHYVVLGFVAYLVLVYASPIFESRRIGNPRSNVSCCSVVAGGSVFFGGFHAIASRLAVTVRTGALSLQSVFHEVEKLPVTIFDLATFSHDDVSHGRPLCFFHRRGVRLESTEGSVVEVFFHPKLRLMPEACMRVELGPKLGFHLVNRFWNLHQATDVVIKLGSRATATGERVFLHTFSRQDT